MRAKEILKGALSVLGIGVCVLTAPEGMAALALTVGLSTDLATAALTMDILPVSLSNVNDAIIGRASNPNVKTVEREVAGVRVRLVYVRPTSPFFPAKLLVLVNDQAFQSLTVNRWALTIEEPFGVPFVSVTVGGRSVGIWYNTSAIAAWVVDGYNRSYTYENATHVCTVVEGVLLSYTWTVGVWQVAGEVNPPIVVRSTTKTQVACQPKPSKGSRCDVSCALSNTSSTTQYATVKVSVAAGCGHAVAIPGVWFYPSGPEVTVPVGSRVVVKATPCEGASFDRWEIYGTTWKQVREGWYGFIVNGSVTVRAYFTNPSSVPKLVIKAETVNKEPVYVNMTGWVFWANSNGIFHNTSLSNAFFRGLEFTLNQQYPMGFKLAANKTAVWVGVKAM